MNFSEEAKAILNKYREGTKMMDAELLKSSGERENKVIEAKYSPPLKMLAIDLADVLLRDNSE